MLLRNIKYLQIFLQISWLTILLWSSWATVVNAATDCNAVTEIPVSECQSLMTLYHSTDGENWTGVTGWNEAVAGWNGTVTRWNENNTPCRWTGLTCTNGHVTEIFLTKSPDNQKKNLSWTLPSLDLPHLTRLYLVGIELSGNIPNFDKLPNLISLELGGNQLSGNIPNFDKLPNLISLELWGNQLSGDIPDFDKLPELRTLHLGNNRLNGNLPNFNLPNLTHVWLGINPLSGNIPNFDKLPNLEFIDLIGSQLVGSVPNFDKLPKLQSLGFNFNQLTGTVPNFDKLPNLKILALNSNQLSGNIPNFDRLGSLDYLNLNDNQLSGNIPNFDKLPNLTWLDLSGNQLSGSIPSFPAFNISNMVHLQFSNNCELTPYDVEQEAIINSKDSNWRNSSVVCPRLEGVSGNSYIRDHAMTVGLLISGSKKRVMVRALSIDGIVDPSFEVLTQPDGKSLGKNDSWTTDPTADELRQNGLAPVQDTDAAMILELPPGLFTIEVTRSPNSSNSGNGMVEIYDMDVFSSQSPSYTSKFDGVSVNGYVGDLPIISGIFAAGNKRRIMIRASSIDGVLDPAVEVFSYPDRKSQGKNDSWMTDPTADELTQKKLAPARNTDAAMILELPAGLFTVEMTTSPNSQNHGTGMVEIYDMDEFK